MYYFSDNSVNEITNIVEEIIVIFPNCIQKELQDFVGKITIKKYCELIDYKNILALLKKSEKMLKKEYEFKRIEKKFEDETKPKLEQLEHFIMLMITRAFTSSNCNRNSCDLKMSRGINR